jgi:hypothetical protein
MYNLIILTTATCRPDIHNITFSKKSLRFFNNMKMPIKWFINIDKTRVCPSDQETTKKNFEILLSNYDIEYIISEKPNYFMAFKNLILSCEKYVDKNTVILNYQDDFILNKDLNLDGLIKKYNYNNSYISLVFNKFGSFPVALIGNKLFEYYKKAFNNATNEIISQRPGIDHITAGYLRNVTLHEDVPIHYFLINYDIEDLKILLSKKNKITGKMKIDDKSFVKTFGNNSFTLNEPRYNLNNKNYLVTNMTEVTEDMIKEIKSVSEQEIQIISFDEFKLICEEYKKQNCFLCIKFGGTHTYMGDKTMDYNNTYFRDVGRFIGESPKLA